jgi:Ca-activated chloride channel family protein
MSDSSSRAQILVQPLRAGLRTGEAQVIDVLVRVQAAEHPPAGEAAAPRLPHALALVIDRSGSMQGKPLDEAKRCAEFVVSRLAPTDALALVQFDNRVERLWPAVPLRDGDSVRSAIGRIECGGTTNLHGGWLHGADSLAGLAGEGLKRVILLSDGCANEGLTDTDDIAKQCAQWAARGISTSTYGLGQSFNEDLMVNMARAGGGSHYYGDTAQDLMEPFERELDLIARLAMRRPVVSVKTAEGVTCTLQNTLIRATDGGWYLPDVAYGAEAWALLSLSIPEALVTEPGALARLLEVSVSATGTDAKPIELPAAFLRLPVLSRTAWAELESDSLVQRRLSELRAAAMLSDMRQLVAGGEWENVDRLLNEARTRFGDNPWLGDVMRSMTELANERDEARLMKESVFFESSACSRLVERNEAMDPAMERVDIPSYLRRKVRQGKAGRA